MRPRCDIRLLRPVPTDPRSIGFTKPDVKMSLSDQFERDYAHIIYRGVGPTRTKGV